MGSSSIPRDTLILLLGFFIADTVLSSGSASARQILASEAASTDTTNPVRYGNNLNNVAADDPATKYAVQQAIQNVRKATPMSYRYRSSTAVDIPDSSPVVTIYAYGGCDQKLSPKECSACLQVVGIQDMNTCSKPIGAEEKWVYCFLQYENYSADDLVIKYALQQAIQNVRKATPMSYPYRGSTAVDVPDSSPVVTIYAYGSCDQKLSPEECSACLKAVGIRNMKTCSKPSGAQGKRVYCFLQYENYSFF